MYLSSIEALESSTILQTQNRPVLVHASDGESYYCKYHRPVGEAHRLFKEFLIANYLKHWNLHFAPFNLIKVLPQHVGPELTIPSNRFDSPCFGSQILTNSEDLTRITENVIANSRKTERVKEYLVKIAFFDIWTSNEDRHWKNYNLLFFHGTRGYELVPIDHEACFNSQNFERGIEPIDYESSLIYTPLFSKVYSVRDFKNPEKLDKLRESFYFCSRQCEKETGLILNTLPLEWNVNIQRKENQLNEYLFNDQWFNNAWHLFLEFLQYFSN